MSLFLDFLFLDGAVAIFKVALALLSTHESLILECDSFETVSSFIKVVIPQLNDSTSQAVFSLVSLMLSVFSLDSVGICIFNGQCRNLYSH